MHVLNADYQDQQLDLQLDRLEATVVDFVTRTSHNYSVRPLCASLSARQDPPLPSSEGL